MRTRNTYPKPQTMSRKVAQLEKSIEIKMINNGMNGTVAVAGTPAYHSEIPLVLMPAADTTSTRTGNKIRVKQITVRGLLTTPFAWLEPTQCKVFISQCKNWNGASGAPAFQGGPYGVYPSVPSNSDPTTALPDLIKGKTAIKVLKEKNFVVNPKTYKDYDSVTGNTTGVIPQTHYFELKVKNLNILVQYVDANAVSESILSNFLSVGVATNSNCNLSITTETLYTDA